MHYLDFPPLARANNGLGAAIVLDVRREAGVWLMAFHGERHEERSAHSAALGLAWSEDLEHWRLP